MHQNKNPQQSPWQRRRQLRRQQDDQLAIERKQQDEQLATERKQALDASAPRLRNLFIFVQVFLLYVVVSIFGVDDRDLLNPNSTIKVPLLNIGLPTFYFFLLAPVLITLLHINLLLHHQAYQDKLRHWRDGAPKAQLDQLAPNFFDIAFLAQDRWQRQLVRASLWFLLYFWPPATLCLALFWFADYQNPWITLEHFALLIISYGASVYLSWRQGSSRHELKALSLWALTLLLGFLIFVGVYILTSSWFFYRLKPLFSLTYITLLIIGGGISVHLPWSKICTGNVLQKLSRWLQGLLLSALPLVGTYLFALVVSLTWISYERSDPWFENYSLYKPKIDAPSFTYQKLDTSTIDLASAYETNATNAELIKNYSEPLDLRGRSLRYANLASSFLPRVRLASADLADAHLVEARLQSATLRGAQLQGANLWQAQLQDAVLREAQLQGASFGQAQLQGASLGQAQLQSASLGQAQLQGADLSDAHLQGAELIEAHLQGADLSDAHLQGAELIKAHLQGADLSSAHLQGAYLIDASLQGARLSSAHLQGAYLIDASLQGARLSSAHLQGADLTGASLQGARLSSAHLQGADLTGASLHGADLSEAQLQGAYLVGASLQGAVLHEAQLQGAYLIGASLHGADLREAQLQGADFTSTRLQGANLRNARLQDADLWEAPLQGSYLLRKKIQGTNFEGLLLKSVRNDVDLTVGLRLFVNRQYMSINPLIYSVVLGIDLSNAKTLKLSASEANSIIVELEEVKQLDGLFDDHQRTIDNAITRIRAAIDKPWTLEGSGAITGVLTQEMKMIDEILEQWDD